MVRRPGEQLPERDGGLTPPVGIDLRRIAPEQVLASVTEALTCGTALIVPTSGTTGAAKAVVLSAAALQASASAVADRLGGHGQWLAALSPTHVGGLGVYVRSVLAGTTPVILAQGRFTVRGFVAATACLRSDVPRYVSLVPTHVDRLLAETDGVEALRTFDRVLIGGAAIASATLETLKQAEIAATHTYGMSETCGGVLHDGVALRGVKLRRADGEDEASGTSGSSGRLLVSGPMLADGYLDRRDLDGLAFESHQGVRWFRTSDLGRWDAGQGRWLIVGRVDDVIITGGHNVHPSAVQEALEALPDVAEATVVGVPDAQWGQAVAALLVPASSEGSARLRSDPRRWVRSQLRDALPAYALPWRVAITERLPRLPGGKVDLRGAQTAFPQEGDRI